MDADERALLADTVHEAVAGTAGLDVADTDGALDSLGWLEMLDAEPRDATAIVFTTLGTTNAVGTALDDVLTTALGLPAGPERAVLLPPFGASTAPGRLDGGRVEAHGLASARAATAYEIVVVVDAGDGPGLASVPVGAVELTPIHGMDPEAGLFSVRVDGAAADALGPAGDWDAAVAAGRRAIGYQVAGATRTMLGFAREHALERVQFDRPIARFQAVRHRLAEALVAIESLEAALDAAWEEPVPLTAALAKVIAGRSARTVGVHCQQVLAGIGFTTEHPFHRFLKRTMVLDGLLGTADEIAVEIGRELVAKRTVPTLIEL